MQLDGIDLSYGGAPPWVYKKRQATLTSSYESQISDLRARIKELEEENAKLRKTIAEFDLRSRERTKPE